MQGGTLADDYPRHPKALFVFEGLLATCPTPRLEERALRWNRFRRALDMWIFETMVLHTLRGFANRYEKNFDVVTWHPSAFARLLEERLDDMGVHPQTIFADRYELLQIDVAMDRNYDVVFDPDHSHAHGYGWKCRVVSPREIASLVP